MEETVGLISHYGLHWSVDRVYWGAGRSKGSLMGRLKATTGRKGAPTSNQKRKAVGDYRDYIGLYCLYSGEALLYIGEAGLETKSNLFTRLKYHRNSGMLAGRWNRFSWFGVEPINGQESHIHRLNLVVSLQHLEAISIAITNPGYNRQSGAFKGAKRVYQEHDKRAFGEMQDKLDYILMLLE